MNKWLDQANQTVMSLEQSFVNLISSVVPWLAPVAPAVLTYQNLTERIAFEPVWALIVAIVVEFLGLSTVSTAFMLWKHNQRYKNKRYHLPMWMPLFSFGFYLFLITTLNVLIEYMAIDHPELASYTEIAAKAMLLFLTVPASAVLVVRSQYVRITSRIRRTYAKPRPERAKVRLDDAKQVLDDPKEEVHTCPHCSETFATVQGLNSHVGRWCKSNPDLVQETAPQNGRIRTVEAENGDPGMAGEGRLR